MTSNLIEQIAETTDRPKAEVKQILEADFPMIVR